MIKFSVPGPLKPWQRAGRGAHGSFTKLEGQAIRTSSENAMQAIRACYAYQASHPKAVTMAFLEDLASQIEMEIEGLWREP